MGRKGGQLVSPLLSSRFHATAPTTTLGLPHTTRQCELAQKKKKNIIHKVKKTQKTHPSQCAVTNDTHGTLTPHAAARIAAPAATATTDAAALSLATAAVD